MAYQKTEKYPKAEMNNILLEEGYKWCVEGELSTISVNFTGFRMIAKGSTLITEQKPKNFAKSRIKSTI